MTSSSTNGQQEKYNGKENFQKSIFDLKKVVRLMWLSRMSHVKNMSNIKCQTGRLWMKFAKKELYMVSFKYNELTYEVTYGGHGNCSKHIL